MSRCYSNSKQDSTGHHPNHRRSARRQSTNRKSKISGAGVNSDQRPDGGEWRKCYNQALATPRKCSEEHSNLEHPTEFCDILLAI